MNKKLLYLMTCGAFLIAGDSFGMDPLGAIPTNALALRQKLTVVHAEGVQKLAAVKPFAAPTSAIILAGTDEARDLRVQLVALQGSLGLGDTIFGADGTTPFYSDTNARNDINLTGALLSFMNAHTHSNGGHNGGGHAPLAGTDGAAVANSILSHYQGFCAAVGDVDAAAADVQHFRIGAKGNAADAATTRTKAALVAGLTVDNLTHGPSVATIAGADEQDCLWMGLLALVEIAELGSLGNTQLDGAAHAPLGYTPGIMANIKAILAALH